MKVNALFASMAVLFITVHSAPLTVREPTALDNIQSRQEQVDGEVDWKLKKTRQEIDGVGDSKVKTCQQVDGEVGW